MVNAFDPMATFQQAQQGAYTQQQGFSRDRARMRAGEALRRGDTQGAAGELYDAGDIEGGQGVIDAQARQRDREFRLNKEQHDQAIADMDRKVGFLKQAASALRQLPEGERAAAYAGKVAPALKMLGMDQATIDAAAGHLDDTSLDTFSDDLDKQVQIINLQRGGVGAYDKRAGTFKTLREPDKTPPPAGYTWGQGGDGEQILVAIPGGPRDPRVIGSNAEASARGHRKGAPPIGRAGGGKGAAKPAGAKALGVNLDSNDGW